jgi:hypothetical protein
VRTVEGTHLDRITFFAALKVITDVISAASSCRLEVRVHGTLVVFGVGKNTILAASFLAIIVDPPAGGISHTGDPKISDVRRLIRGLGEVVVGRSHRNRPAKLRRAPQRQRVAHHGPETEARRKDSTLIDTQVFGDFGEYVVEKLDVSVVIPGEVPNPLGCYKDNGIIRFPGLAVQAEEGVVLRVEVGTIKRGVLARCVPV